MKKLLLMAAGLLVLSTAASAQQTETYPSYISVTGSAERDVTPDEIYVGITIDESDSRNGKITVAEQERRMVAELKKLGIDVDKDLQVGDMSGDLKSYVLRRDRVQTQKNYVLKVGDAATLGKVFQSLAAIDISRMNLIKATRSDIEQIRLELRAEAMKSARRSADTLAEAIGQKAGKAFMINDNNYYGGGTVYFNSAMPVARSAKMEMATEDAGSAIEFQDMKVNCSVNVRFILE
jgi:hypothetical protein